MMHNNKICPICGREIRPCNLKRHVDACDGQLEKIPKYRLNHDGLTCQFCGKECKNRNSLCNHERMCRSNPNRQILDKKYNRVCTKQTRFNTKGVPPWNKGLTKYTDDRIRKSSIKVSQTTKGREGKKHTQEEIEKIREATISNIIQLHGSIKTRYNPNACRYIDQLNEKYDWNLQHAENGGEVCIGGYFLDGYDKDLNIAFEYDEPRHYFDVVENKLKEKDINRMNYIIQKTDCRFFRYNEKLDYFYEVS